MSDLDLADLFSAIDSAKTTMALHSRDWSAGGRDAWLYGIFLGWDGDPDDPDSNGSTDELATQFGWSTDSLARLRTLHAAIEAFTINAIGDLDRLRDELAEARRELTEQRMFVAALLYANGKRTPDGWSMEVSDEALVSVSRRGQLVQHTDPTRHVTVLAFVEG